MEIPQFLSCLTQLFGFPLYKDYHNIWPIYLRRVFFNFFLIFLKNSISSDKQDNS